MVIAGMLRGRHVPQAGDALVRAGARLALLVTIVQLFAGAWVLLTLPPESRNGMLGDDGLAAGLLVVSIGAVFGLLHLLSQAALGELDDRVIRRSAWLMLLLVLLMTSVLVRGRRLSSFPIGWRGRAEICRNCRSNVVRGVSGRRILAGDGRPKVSCALHQSDVEMEA